MFSPPASSINFGSYFNIHYPSRLAAARTAYCKMPFPQGRTSEPTSTTVIPGLFLYTLVSHVTLISRWNYITEQATKWFYMGDSIVNIDIDEQNQHLPERADPPLFLTSFLITALFLFLPNHLTFPIMIHIWKYPNTSISVFFHHWQ